MFCTFGVFLDTTSCCYTIMYEINNIIAVVPHVWTYCGSRVPSCRVRTEAMLPTLCRVGFHGSTCGRRRPRQSYHRRYDETARQFGVREDGQSSVTNIDRHRDVKYCTEVGTSALINNKRFRQLDVVTDDAYEIELNKQVVKYTLPLHIGFFVYQYAKLRMLQFYYDFIDRYVERPLFQYCEVDTDSAYIVLAGETIDDLITSEHREHYFRHRSEWLPAECCDEHEDEYVQARLAGRALTATESCCIARQAFDKRTSGLFKVEWRGEGFVGLCSKKYYCFGTTDKCSTKGLSKRQNAIDKEAFLAVLTNRSSSSGTNHGFRVHN